MTLMGLSGARGKCFMKIPEVKNLVTLSPQFSHMGNCGNGQIHVAAFWLQINYVDYGIYSVADPHHIDADPNSTYHFDGDPDHDFYLMQIRIRRFTLMQIRIQILPSK
jgi:hypothetical protein